MRLQAKIGLSNMRALLLAAGFCGIASSGAAQSLAEFYKDKTMAMVIGIPPGGGYDLAARLLARHMTRHIPGRPTIVPQNMPGGGELNAANYVAAVAPKDGTAIAAVVRTVPFLPLYGNTAAKFDPLKLNWLGSPSQEVGLFVAWRGDSDMTFKDLFAKEVIVGVNIPGSDTYTYANILKHMFDAKIKIVSGYPGSEDIMLAMQRGEVHAISNMAWSNLQRRPDWIRDKKINIVVQNGLRKLPELPDVPLLIDLARTDEERAILQLMLAQTIFGRPYFLASDVPADRVAALRNAFMATMSDEEFLADSKKQKIEIDPVSGSEMQESIARIYQTPRGLVDKASAIRTK
jgi:tripartite-type tricarboxylate transporter receptor subunit TctC